MTHFRLVTISFRFCSNSLLASQCDPIKTKSAVWVLHPDHPGKTIALARAGPHWRSYKKGFVPNVKGVSWEYGMQQITIDHVYPEFSQAKVLFGEKQRDGIATISDALSGEFSEDATILWKTRYINYVEVCKVK